jgi:hypothetical protein
MTVVMSTLSRVPALRFCDIDFGYASAEKESAEAPSLLVEGFFDLDGVRQKLRDGPEFLCLGYKGSGKSAIGEHLRLTADADPTFFVKRMYLADFPFTDFGQILRGSQDVKARYPPTWAWLLLLQLIASFDADAGLRSGDPRSFTQTVDLLKRFGLVPAPGLHETVLKSKERSFRVSLGKSLEAGTKGTLASTGDMNFLALVETLRKIIENARSDSRHLLIIDGLDDILLREPIQFDALAALVVEVARLNAALRGSGAPAKVILLCRTDIYSRLPGPNLNKIKLDAGVELDWFDDPAHPERSNLIALAAAKGKVSDSKLDDLFTAFLPISIDARVPIPIQRFLLERARHVPRDFLQLLKAIQKAGGQQKGRLSQDTVRAGARAYSQSYFIAEIRDELAGHFDQLERDAAFECLGSLSSSQFTLAEFEKIAEASSVSFDARGFLTRLYDCGAIGTREDAYVTFRYRNPHVPFNPREVILLHRALVPALNVPSAYAKS